MSRSREINPKKWYLVKVKKLGKRVLVYPREFRTNRFAKEVCQINNIKLGKQYLVLRGERLVDYDITTYSKILPAEMQGLIRYTYKYPVDVDDRKGRKNYRKQFQRQLKRYKKAKRTEPLIIFTDGIHDEGGSIPPKNH